MIFLIQYAARGSIVTLERFNESERKRDKDVRLEMELELNRRDVEREVVLLEAETEEALRRTHRRYFEDLAGLVKEPA